ncbi:hypothetical protein [Leptospira stimsonii]|uniref:Uncharacterized protein n=1 Tax=Leptospira stimsonii TaxID=2202203 RepID=A0A8B3CML0_9LEPT|nr:hypothetical protein [Leptospira stimsonii]RHX84889.1 hypothetical protein DLM78_15760 [Leptospira stimsonii]
MHIQYTTDLFGLLLCFLFLSCLKDADANRFKFYYLPTSLSNLTNPFVSNDNVTNSPNFTFAGGKSFYNGIYYVSTMTSGQNGFNINLSFANLFEGTELRICLNDPGCLANPLLYSVVLASGVSNLDLNLPIPGTYPVNIGGNSLNVALINNSQIISQKYNSLIYDNSAPSLSLSVSGGTYTSVQTISVTCTDSISGCKDLIYSINGADSSLSLLTDFDPLQIVSGAVFPISLGIGSGTSTLKILASDRAGNLVGPLTPSIYP